MGTPGVGELLIVLVIVLVLFGAKKLPDLASSMGRSIREFRKATEELDGDGGKDTDTAATGSASNDDKEA